MDSRRNLPCSDFLLQILSHASALKGRVVVVVIVMNAPSSSLFVKSRSTESKLQSSIIGMVGRV